MPLPVDVWVYWEGHRWPYIDLCLATIERACRDGRCRFHLVDGDNWREFMPADIIHADWREIKELGIRSDCVRACVLAAHGGIYLDADTICLRSPALMADDSKDFKFCKWSNPPERFIAGYVWARPGSIVAKHWLANVNEVLDRDGVAGAKWCALGEGCLAPAVRSVPADQVEEMPLKAVLPIEIDCEVARFFDEGDWREFTTEDTVAFGLNHSWMTSRKPKLMDLPTEKIDASPLVIHRLLSYARRYLVEPPWPANPAKYEEEIAFWRAERDRYVQWYRGEWPDFYGVPAPERDERGEALAAWCRADRDRYLRHLMLSAEQFAGQRILDVGSGPLGLAAAFKGAEVWALDPLTDAYREAGYPLDSQPIRYVSDYAERMTSIETDSFDAVVSVNAIDHVDDFAAAIREIERVVKPDGVIRLEVHYHEPCDTEPLALDDEQVAAAFERPDVSKVSDRPFSDFYPPGYRPDGDRLTIWSNFPLVFE